MVPLLGVHLLDEFSLRYDERPVTDLASTRLPLLLAFFLLHRDPP